MVVVWWCGGVGGLDSLVSGNNPALREPGRARYRPLGRIALTKGTVNGGFQQVWAYVSP
jgi:hypothetical protein